MTNINDNEIGAIVRNITVKQLVHKYGLEYAYYTIMDRALVSDDGLKNVNRRILYTLFLNKNMNSRMVKAGSTAAETMGSFHPHGNQSIEAALARMAQDFSMRVPLIDYQGSVGLVTGDQPSAARYWECCLSDAGLELVKDVDKNTVPMKRNFSDTLDEPVLLPVRFPNAIINGTMGIAVGYASNIFPHNPDEVMDACIERLKGNINNVDDLMKYIKGPDMPTGGLLLGQDGAREYLETGSGTFIIRGKYEMKKLSRGRTEITFYELPYQVSPEQVMTAIRKAQENKNQLKDISEVKDLSDMKNGLRLSIYVKAGANPKIVLEDLWKNTPCEQRFSTNSTVLLNGKPQQVGMIELIDQFLIFKEECFVRGTEFKIKDLEKELERLEGILAVLVDIDKAIKIIRNAENAEEANAKLQKAFKINENQASYILQMQLRTLTKQDKNKTIERKESIESEHNKLCDILEDEDKLINAIVEDLKKTKKIISDPRRTEITGITMEDIKDAKSSLQKIERALSKNIDCYLTLYDNCHILKTIEPVTQSDLIPIRQSFLVKSLDNIFIITKAGKAIEYEVNNIPVDTDCSIELLGIGLDNFINVVSNDCLGILSVTNKGNVNITRTPIKEDNLIKLEDDEFIVYAEAVTQDDLDNKVLMLLSNDGNLAKFKLDQVRQANQGSGTISGMRDNEVVGAAISNNEGNLVTYSDFTIKVTDIPTIPTTGRGVKGSMLHKTGKDENLSGIRADIKKALNDNDKNFILPQPTGRAVKGDKMPIRKIKYMGY